MDNKIKQLLSCDDCKFAACEQCEISYTDKKMIYDYITELEEKLDEYKKGNDKLMSKRKKWKERFYKLKRKYREKKYYFDRSIAWNLFKASKRLDNEKIICGIDGSNCNNCSYDEEFYEKYGCMYVKDFLDY